MVGSRSRPRGATLSSVFEQVIRIILDRRHAVLGEQVREHVHHRFAVLEHVGHARGCARVVLQHEEVVLAGAHDVDADDVAVDAERRLDANHLGHEGRVGDDQFLGDLARLDDLLAVIDVVHEGVERAHALLDAGRQTAPFGRRDDARNDVEGDEPLGRFIAAVDGEGDAGAAEHRLRLEQLLLQIVELLRAEPFGDGLIGHAHTVTGAVHFIKSLPQRCLGFDRRLFLPQLPPQLPKPSRIMPANCKKWQQIVRRTLPYVRAIALRNGIGIGATCGSVLRTGPRSDRRH